MQGILYEVVGLGFVLGSGYFFFRAMEFLAGADYVAGLLGLVIAFLVVRAGVDISRLALASRMDEDKP